MSKKDYLEIRGKGVVGLVKKSFIEDLKKPVKKRKKMSKKGLQALKELEKEFEPIDEVFK